MLRSIVRNACAWSGLAVALVLGCASEDSNDGNEDAGPQRPDSATIDPPDGAAADAAPPHDSAVMNDAEPADAAGDLCVAGSFEVTSNGGLVAYRDRAIVEPCNTVRFERVEPDGTVIESCTGTLAVTPDPTGALNTLLLDDGVRNAIRDAPITFGIDRRFVDAPITQLVINDKVIEVGLPCEDAGQDSGTRCTPIPEGIVELMNELGALFEAQIAATPSCSAFER